MGQKFLNSGIFIKKAGKLWNKQNGTTELFPQRNCTEQLLCVSSEAGIIFDDRFFFNLSYTIMVKHHHLL